MDKSDDFGVLGDTRIVVGCGGPQDFQEFCQPLSVIYPGVAALVAATWLKCLKAHSIL